jgi:hypothetical protein
MQTGMDKILCHLLQKVNIEIETDAYWKIKFCLTASSKFVKNI